MPVNFSTIKPGRQYTRPELAKLWGYEAYQAIARGMFTPAGQRLIVLFVTEEKQTMLTQYEDRFDGKTLKMEGETNHQNDDRIANAKTNGDTIQLFYRKRHHSPFTHYGTLSLVEYQPNASAPSRFVLEVV
jgi:hypothetical protein